MARNNPAGDVRERLVQAALGLFAQHGVNGTSLQMIADEIGVTKAAVYYHFPSKEDLVEAVVTPYLRDLAAVVEAAEGRHRRADRLDTLLGGIIDLLVDNRELHIALQADPVIRRHVDGRPDMRDLGMRAGLLMMGTRTDTHALIITLIVSGGLAYASTSPYLADLDDTELRRELHTTARRILGIKTPITQH
ncbi:TetR/AcrR family transcriptional regulator [Actinomadura rugatobispora]|uniref:TetR/AcrR family transcriptional regulator n=1 Tax=Actinomadura rugatobispora TaxID=1994 RepID=A0ABW0ZZ88_9ACTN|nr:TetR family transcriptional regulator [Actinomadura rugatobispora]